MPDEVQPLALLQSLPRIANTIAHLWHDDAALRAYLDELLVDQRGGRRGFPPEIQNELLILREYCEGRFPGHRLRCSGRVLRGRRAFAAAVGRDAGDLSVSGDRATHAGNPAAVSISQRLVRRGNGGGMRAPDPVRSAPFHLPNRRNTRCASW